MSKPFNLKQFTLSNDQFSSIRTLSGATTPGQSGPWSDGNEELLRILDYWKLTIRLFVSDSGYSLGVGSYSSAEKQPVYSTDPANWAVYIYML